MQKIVFLAALWGGVDADASKQRTIVTQYFQLENNIETIKDFMIAVEMPLVQ